MLASRYSHLARTHRDFLLLLAAYSIAGAGDTLLCVTLLSIVHEMTHDPLAVGATSLIQALPAIGGGLWIGRLLDRHDRRGVLVAASLLNAAASMG